MADDDVGVRPSDVGGSGSSIRGMINAHASSIIIISVYINGLVSMTRPHGVLITPDR